jgi:hypothetical protein
MDSRLYELLRQCTLRIDSAQRGHLGTGFFVAPGLIVTCAHVVEDVRSEAIDVFWNGQSYPVQLKEYRPEPEGPDLALLSIDLQEHPCVWLHEGATPFDALYSYGYPDDDPGGASTTFTLEGPSGEQGELLKFQSGQVRPGQSGAPLLNTQTSGVCGVVYSTRGRASDLGGGAITTAILLQTFPELVALQRQFHERNQRWLSYVSSAQAEKRQRIELMWIDQSDFVQDRFDRFVGRQDELALIRQRIEENTERGGYVIITGDVGQGKSSIIAKMIEDQGRESTAYHFIQRDPGSGYQLSLLRSLMARLILKYDLPEHYVAGESYPILRDLFPRLLTDISREGKREVIYIDGLDLLETDTPAGRDFSFLPSRLPPGSVIVLGMRPNETLGQVERRIGKQDPYRLPGLSREDFKQLLSHRHVSLPAALVDSLYGRLTNNPLYLDLVAQELREQPTQGVEELIARVENNPDAIFTITFSRMQAQSEWHEIIRPILGALLVAQEPLSYQQIAHIFGKESDRIRTGIERLGGLLSLAAQRRHTLFHPKLKDYLQPDEPESDIQFDAEERQKLHERFVAWCEQGTVEQLWESPSDPSSPHDDYREYARRHYITHLHAARHYEQLFAILNAGDYERGKLRFDPSTRASAADLLLGCQAAAGAVTSLAEGESRITHLWRYTLLRTSLTTRADAYPIEAFQALLALGRTREAQNLAELLTQPAKKLAVLTLLAEHLFRQPEQEVEGVQFYSRVYEIALSLEDKATQTTALSNLTEALIHAGQLERATDSARSIVDDAKRAEALTALCAVYGERNDWEQAENIAHEIAISEERARALCDLASRLHLAHQEGKAEALRQEAGAIIPALASGDSRDRASYHLALSFMQAKEWERAEAVVGSIDSATVKVSAWCQLALSFTKEGLTAQAESAWNEAQILIKRVEKRDKACAAYALARAQAGFYDEAETTASKGITEPTEKVAVLSGLASDLISKGLWNQSRHIIELIAREYEFTDVPPLVLDVILIRLSIELADHQQWGQAEATAHAIPRKEAQCRALMGSVSELARAGRREMAQDTWNQAQVLCTAQTDAVQSTVAGVLVRVLVEAGQIERARQIIATLPDKQTSESVMKDLAIALARAGWITEAEEIAGATINPRSKASIQESIALAQMNAGQFEQAIATASAINKKWRLYVLSKLVTICCDRQQWDHAEQIARDIPSDDVRASALTHIAIGLGRSGDRVGAERIAGLIGNNFLNAKAISDIAPILAAAGYIVRAQQLVRNIRNSRLRDKAFCNIALRGLLGAEEAESIARSIDASKERDEALCNVARAYAETYSWDEAERIAEEIDDVQIQDEAWGAIAIERTRAGQWTAACTAFDKIQKASQRIAVLQDWGILLADPANKEGREQIAQHLGKMSEKASLLVSIANTLAQAGQYLEQVHLVQQAWLQARTKEDCQYLFAMVKGLLLRNPELCTDFYDSFGWVETFLSEE